MRHFFKAALTASAAAMTVLLIGCEATGPASSKIGRLFVESHFNEDGTYAALPASSAPRPFDEDRLENDIDLVSFLVQSGSKVNRGHRTEQFITCTNFGGDTDFQLF